MVSKKNLKRLYCDKKLSMVEIADALKTTTPKVFYWMKKHNIKRRGPSESAYIKQNPDGDPFKVPKKLSRAKEKLLMAGLYLFWAEGNKSHNGTIQLANLDHRMLRLFTKFLREIYKIKEEKLSLYVRVHAMFNKCRAKLYWSRLLNISPEKVLVYTHTDARSKFNKQWSKHGIATLQFSSTKLRGIIDQEIERHIIHLLER